MVTPQDIKISKRLAILVVEAGEAGIPEIRPVLEKILAGRANSDRKAFLKLFHKAVLREIKNDTLVVESARPLDPSVLDTLVADFSKDRQRALQVVQRSNPELIAGMRVRLGDTVYDASLANNLQSLANRIR